MLFTTLKVEVRPLLGLLLVLRTKGGSLYSVPFLATRGARRFEIDETRWVEICQFGIPPSTTRDPSTITHCCMTSTG